MGLSVHDEISKSFAQTRQYTLSAICLVQCKTGFIHVENTKTDRCSCLLSDDLEQAERGVFTQLWWTFLHQHANCVPPQHLWHYVV